MSPERLCKKAVKSKWRPRNSWCLSLAKIDEEQPEPVNEGMTKNLKPEIAKQEHREPVEEGPEKQSNSEKPEQTQQKLTRRNDAEVQKPEKEPQECLRKRKGKGKENLNNPEQRAPTVEEKGKGKELLDKSEWRALTRKRMRKQREEQATLATPVTPYTMVEEESLEGLMKIMELRQKSPRNKTTKRAIKGWLKNANVSEILFARYAYPDERLFKRYEREELEAKLRRCQDKDMLMRCRQLYPNNNIVQYVTYPKLFRLKTHELAHYYRIYPNDFDVFVLLYQRTSSYTFVGSSKMMSKLLDRRDLLERFLRQHDEGLNLTDLERLSSVGVLPDNMKAKVESTYDRLESEVKVAREIAEARMVELLEKEYLTYNEKVELVKISENARALYEKSFKEPCDPAMVMPHKPAPAETVSQRLERIERERRERRWMNLRRKISPILQSIQSGLEFLWSSKAEPMKNKTRLSWKIRLIRSSRNRNTLPSPRNSTEIKLKKALQIQRNRNSFEFVILSILEREIKDMLPTPPSSSERLSEVISSCVVSPLLLPRTSSPAISSLSNLSRRSSVYSVNGEPNSGASSERNLSTLSRIHYPQNFPEWVAKLREEMTETELRSEHDNFERWIWLPSPSAYDDCRGNPFEDDFAGDGMAAFSGTKRPQSHCLPPAGTFTSLDINALMASYLMTEPDEKNLSSNLENEKLLQDAYFRAVSDVEPHAQDPNRAEMQSEPHAKFEIMRTIISRSSSTLVETTKEVSNQVDKFTLPDEQASQKNPKIPSSVQESNCSSSPLWKLSSGLACQAKILSHSLTQIESERSETIAGREYSFDMDSRTEDKKSGKKGPMRTLSLWKSIFTWKEAKG